MPYKSLYPPVPIPDVDLWQLVFEREQTDFPRSKEIFTSAETGRTYTYEDVRHNAIEFGKGLKARWGWKKGDVLAFYTPNSIDTGVTTLGAIWAGGVISPANPLYTVEELAFQLQDARAKALITQPAYLTTAIEAAKRVGLPLDRIILVGETTDGRFRHFCSIRSTSYTGEYAKARIDPREDLAFLVYSSGTTGMPKGVRLSHYNMVANIMQFTAVDGREFRPYGGIDGKGDKQLGVLPFFHIYGLQCCVLANLYRGLLCVVMEKFDLQKTLEAIQKHGITWIYVPPPIILAFGKHPLVDEYELVSLKVLHSAAAPLTRELTESVWQRLKIPVKQGFGLSETSPVCHTQTTPEWARFMGSVGKLLPNMEAKIVDDAGNEVGEDETGELLVKGPNIFQGYLNNPERTKEAFTHDGWFKTGDVFRRDKHGNYYCVDRLKELIKYKGFPVPPAELEGLLVTHPDVADACVIGVEDRAQATEVPCAYVVLKQGVEASEDKARDLVEWIAAKVAPHKRLRGGVRFVPTVPKSPSGKILRRLMRDQVVKEGKVVMGPKL